MKNVKNTSLKTQETKVWKETSRKYTLNALPSRKKKSNIDPRYKLHMANLDRTHWKLVLAKIQLKFGFTS